MAEKVKVEALKYHTYNGKAYQVGDTYDFIIAEGPGLPSADQQVEALQVNGFATRVDRVEVAKKAAKQPAKKSTPKAAKPTVVKEKTATPQSDRTLVVYRN